MKARSLECRTGRSPATFEELQALRAAVWHQQGKISLDPETITDPWLRQALLNEAARQFGPRNASATGGSGAVVRKDGQGYPGGPWGTKHEPVARKTGNRGG